METKGSTLVDYTFVKEKIEQSKIPLASIAKILEIQPRTLKYSLDGKRRFRDEELILLRRILKLTDEEFLKIFK